MIVGKQLTFVEFFNTFYEHAKIIPGWESIDLTSQLEIITGLWRVTSRNSENVSQKIADPDFIKIYLLAFIKICKIDQKNIKEIIEFATLIEVIKYDQNTFYPNCMFTDYFTDEIFSMSCSNGYIKLAKWVHSLDAVNIHVNIDRYFKQCCILGHIELAKWLYYLGGVDIHSDNDDAFKQTCIQNHIELAKWLYSLGGVDIHDENETAFTHVCENGNIEFAKWLYSLGDIDIHIFEEHIFRHICMLGRIEMAKWLHSLGDVDIHARNDIAFDNAFRLGHVEIIAWLSELAPYSSKMIEDLCKKYNTSKCVKWAQVYLESRDSLETMDKSEMQDLRNANEELTEDNQRLREKLAHMKKKLNAIVSAIRAVEEMYIL